MEPAEARAATRALALDPQLRFIEMAASVGQPSA